MSRFKCARATIAAQACFLEPYSIVYGHFAGRRAMSFVAMDPCLGLVVAAGAHRIAARRRDVFAIQLDLVASISWPATQLIRLECAGLSIAVNSAKNRWTSDWPPRRDAGDWAAMVPDWRVMLDLRGPVERHRASNGEARGPGPFVTVPAAREREMVGSETSCLVATRWKQATD